VTTFVKGYEELELPAVAQIVGRSEDGVAAVDDED
jgi:hypothetical protein